MRILHLMESGGLYGAERFLVDLSLEQMRLGDVPTIVSVGPVGCEEKAIERFARERGVDVKPWRMRAGFNVLGMRELLAHAKKQSVDVLHSHGYRFDTLLPFADPRGSFRRLSTVHGATQTRSGTMRLAQRLGLFFLSRMHRVVFVSQKLQQTFGNGIRNGVCIPNGMALTSVESKRKEPRSKPNDVIELLAVGRLAYEKNFELLIDAVHELGKRNVPCRLTHFGEGQLLPELEQHVQRRGLSNVRFAGYSHEILSHLHNCDALVITSRTEGMPITVIEAMLLGVPIVSTPAGGIPEMLADYPLGHIATKFSADAVASAVAEVCEPGKRRRASDETIARLQSHYSIERVAREYRTIYEQVLADK